MKYHTNINGIDVDAVFSDISVKDIFIPLLKRLSEMHSKKNRRILVMLAAPPGVGKSTLVSFLEYLAKDVLPDKKVQAIGMDGFHRRQEYLISHTTTVGDREVCMVEIKGAPVTFDLEGLKKKISEVAQGKVCGWPVYERLLHNPVEDAILVDGDIVILEGNYLLLDENGWNDLAEHADYTISIIAEPEMLKDRLLTRKMASGCTREEAEKFVEFSDMANVRHCMQKTKNANLELKVCNDLGFVVRNS
ncbi:MAG: nucleoside/nucleotide kinase family protein [Lachnospiraceae bacterium]|nr:nucleoside/nucleotide kinase family protein [Lachnospiraceae bacterium]